MYIIENINNKKIFKKPLTHDRLQYFLDYHLRECKKKKGFVD